MQPERAYHARGFCQDFLRPCRHARACHQHCLVACSATKAVFADSQCWISRVTAVLMLAQTPLHLGKVSPASTDQALEEAGIDNSSYDHLTPWQAFWTVGWMGAHHRTIVAWCVM
jgi:hypothetical protein